MVAIEISEFTFGYAFLYEQTAKNWDKLKAAPILPSLYDESMLGWDAYLPRKGAAYYYQFKLTDYLYRSNALYRRRCIYSAPYYRIALHNRNDNEQHRLLKALANDFPNTYYVAPEILSIQEFHMRFINRQITNGSRLIPISQCRDINDSEQHYITFQPGSSNWNEHSEKEPHEDSIFGRDIAELYERSDFQIIDDQYVREIFFKLRDIVNGMSSSVQYTYIEEDNDSNESGNYKLHDDDSLDYLRNYNPEDHSRSEVLGHISSILSTFFGSTMVIVGQDE